MTACRDENRPNCFHQNGKAQSNKRQIVSRIRRESGETWDLAEAEREVLPPWREARRRVEAARSGPQAVYFPAELEEFFRLREKSWETLVEAVRTNDEELYRRHAEQWSQAEVARQAVKGFERRRPGARPGR